MKKKTYTEKLLDPRWQKKRLEILNRDEFCCQSCYSTENTLHVHHKIYSKGEPWEIDNKYLVTLCEKCHREEESDIGAVVQELINAFKGSEFLSHELSIISKGVSKMQSKGHPFMVASAYAYAFSNPEMQELILEKHREHLSKVKAAMDAQYGGIADV